METKNVLFMLRRWSWFLLLAFAIGLLGGFIVSTIMTPIYKAETKVLISRDPQAATAEFPNLNDTQLVQTYVELLSTNQLRDQVSVMVGRQIYKEDVIVEQLRDTQIIQIAVENKDPEMAQKIANSMVSLLELQIKDMQDKQYLATETSLEEQAAQAKTEMESLQSEIDTFLTQDTESNLAEVNTQIATLENQITVLQSEIAVLGLPTETAAVAQLAEKESQLSMLQNLLAQYQSIHTNLLFLGKPYEAGAGVTNARLDQLQSTLAYYEQIYLGYLSSLEDLRLLRMQNTPTITQIEPAVAPETPDRPVPIIYTAVAGLAGLIIAVIAMIVIELLDDTVKTPEDVEQIAGVPVLGLLRKGPASKNYFFQGKDVSKPPLSALYEDYRTLGFQIENRLPADSFTSLMVTSCTPREGKTTAAVNLATIYTRNGKRVLLLDANQKNSQLLVTLGENSEIRAIDIESAAGERNTRSFDVLDMNKITSAFQNIKERGEMFAIIDTPPMFSADAKILASRVDGVLLVVEAWETKKESLQAAIHQLNQLKANLIGVVLNKIPLKYSYYYDSYHFLSSDYVKYSRFTRTNGKKSKSGNSADERLVKIDNQKPV
ncbi:MAG: hypothetical protein LLG42_07610 [Chloroflexi bacterium]|nr:hypothetical protein [Chloroflexota bacterium]